MHQLGVLALALALCACKGGNSGGSTPAADASTDAGPYRHADAAADGDDDGGPMSVAADGGVARDAGTPDDTLGCRNSNHVSGTRVKMRVAVTDEGSTYWQGFHDTELDIECSYTTITSDESRCLPTSLYAPAPEAFADVTRNSIYYTDDRCSEAVYSLRTSCLIDYLLTPELADVPACVETKSRLYKRGARYTPTSQLYGRSGGDCVPASPSPDVQLYQLGLEQDISSYAKGSPAQWANAGGVAMHGTLGVDGSREARRFWDSTRNQPCGILRLEDKSLHCVPALLAQSHFADNQCSEPLASVDTRCDRDPSPYAIRPSATVCETYTLYRVLDPYTGSVYSGSPCTESAPMLASGVQLHATKRADPAELTKLEETIDATDSGRMQRMHYRNQDGACLLSGMYDGELDARCRFNAAGDGQLRCLPVESTSLIVDSFSDAACTVPIKFVYPEACGKLPPRFAVVSEQDGCTSKNRIYRVLPEPVAASDALKLYGRSSDGYCVQRPLTPGTYYKVGDEVMPEKMTRATIEIR